VDFGYESDEMSAVKNIKGLSSLIGKLGHLQDELFRRQEFQLSAHVLKAIDHLKKVDYVLIGRIISGKPKIVEVD